MASRAILVTGASAGIGEALTRQLLSEHDCRVFLGVRNPDRGAAALAAMGLSADAASRAMVVPCDTTSDASCFAAAEAVKAALGGTLLYAIVNNAGVGLAHGVPSSTIMNTNLYGPMRVTKAFLPLLNPVGGRIVNLGSGSGPTYVKALIEIEGEAVARQLMQPASVAAVLEHATAHMGSAASEKAYKDYGLSKACLTAWTQAFANEHPELIVLCCSPGFINTSMTAGFGACVLAFCTAI